MTPGIFFLKMIQCYQSKKKKETWGEKGFINYISISSQLSSALLRALPISHTSMMKGLELRRKLSRELFIIQEELTKALSLAPVAQDSGCQGTSVGGEAFVLR